MEIPRFNNGTEYRRMLERLTQLRQRCLHATRDGDFRRVARLTLQTAEINAQLRQDEENPSIE